MGRFRTLITIEIEHNYYQSSAINRIVKLLPTAQTELLMRRRGACFSDNTLIISDDFAGFCDDDKLGFLLQVSDANFLRVTKLNGYHPQNFYRIVLQEEKEIDVCSALQMTKEQKCQSEFCRIDVFITKELQEKAKLEEPIKYTLKFKAMDYYWEYLFVIRSNEALCNLVLEESRGLLSFGKSVKLQNSSFGENVWRVVSTCPITTCEHYQYMMVVSELLSESPLKKRTLSRFISCPQPGRYITESQDNILEVCYL